MDEPGPVADGAVRREVVPGGDMDRFEFVFSLIGLLLGLSLVEVLSGLVKARKVRSTIRIGWLTPMLGILVSFTSRVFGG